MFLAVTLFHIGTTYTGKLFSLLQFTLQWRNLLLLGLVNSILVCGLFERHIGTLPPKKIPKRKTC